MQNKNTQKCEVVIVGAAHTDLQLIPVGKDLFDRASYTVKQMMLTVGGDALNESTIITRLGHRVRLISCIGDDQIGKIVIEHCEKNHIDTTYLKQDPQKTTSINVGLISKDGERIFINNRSGSIWTFGPNDINLEAIKDARILSFASYFNNPMLTEEIILKIFKKAKQQGMLICADIVGSKNGEQLSDISRSLSYVDYFFPNYDEASELTHQTELEKIADVLLNIGVKNIVIKIGKRGCFIKNSVGSKIIEAFHATHPLDTTGAGDNFAAGFISGLLEGMTINDCCKMANCAASIAVETVGATNGINNREELEKRYQEYLVQ